MSVDSKDVPNGKIPNSRETQTTSDFKKTCNICKVEFKEDTKALASQSLADHLQEKHSEKKPDPETIDDTDFPNEKKKKFTLKCQTCGHQVQTDTELKTGEIMQTHMLSHDKETEIELKKKQNQNGNFMIFTIGLLALIISAGIVFGGLWMHNKKSFNQGAGK